MPKTRRKRGVSVAARVAVPRQSGSVEAAATERTRPQSPEIIRLSSLEGESEAGACGSAEIWRGLLGTNAPVQQLDFQIPQLHCVDDDIAMHVPPELCTKIWRNEFVNLSMLLKKASNIPSVPQQIVLSDSGQLETRVRSPKSITNIREWTDAFLVFMVIYLKKHGDKVFELIQYMSVIREAEARHKSLAWKIYDEQFRLRQSQDLQSWARINSDLWLRTMTCSDVGQVFAHEPRAAKPRGAFTGDQFRRSTGVCIDYNNQEGCHFRACRYRHICGACRGDHSVMRCPRVFGSQSYSALSNDKLQSPQSPAASSSFFHTNQYSDRFPGRSRSSFRGSRGRTRRPY